MRQYFFPDILRKTNIAFLSLFKNIQVAKRDKDGNVLSMRDVPLKFGHKGKYISIAKKKDKREFSLYLPRISAVISSMTPAPENTNGGHLVPIYDYFSGTESSKDRIFGGTTWKMNFTLSIMTERMTEMSMILEQIIPHFTPYKNITIKEFDFIPEFTKDVKVLLTGVTPIFQDELAEEEKQRIEFDLDFEMDVMFYRPILVSDLIKTIKIEMIDSSLMPATSGDHLSTYTYGVSGEEDDFIEIEDGWEAEED